MSTETEGGPAPEKKTESKPEEKPRVLTTDLPDEALTKRLDQAKNQGKTEAVKELATRLGMTLEEAEAKLAKARELEDAQKSELQRANERAEALAPVAARAEASARRIQALSEQEYSELPDEMKGVVDDLANAADGTPDHEKRIDVIVSLRKRGLLEKKPAPFMPKGADTSKADAAPKTETKDEPDSPDAHFKKWDSFSSEVLKAAYWNDNHGKIREAAAYKAKHGAN